jgi:hypothetical protein
MDAGRTAFAKSHSHADFSASRSTETGADLPKHGGKLRAPAEACWFIAVPLKKEVMR